MRCGSRAPKPLGRTYPGTPRMSEFSENPATAPRCHATATASRSIACAGRTRRCPGGLGQRLGRRQGIRRLLGFGSRFVSSGFVRVASAARHALPQAGLAPVLPGFSNGFLEVGFDLGQIRLGGDAEILDALHLLFLEVDSQPALQRFFDLAGTEEVVIVPAAVIECIRHHRGAQQEAHLAARHAFLELRDRIGHQVVALLNIHFVDAAGGEQRTGEQDR